MDYKDKKCPPHKAYFHRIATKKNGRWEVKDYYVQGGQLQMTGHYLDDSLSLGEGIFYRYYKNGMTECITHLKNGKHDGLHLHYDSSGRLTDSTLHKDDLPYKYGYKWNGEGQLIFKGIYKDDMSGGETWSYFGDGSLSAYGIVNKDNKKDSIWTYFHRNGNVSCKDYYTKTKLKKRECFDENGNKKKGKCKDATEPKIVGGNRKLMQLLEEYRPALESLRTKRRLKGRMVVEVCIDEQGILSCNVLQHLDPEVDRIFIEIIGKVKCKPMIIHNRPEEQCETAHFDWD